MQALDLRTLDRPEPLDERERRLHLLSAEFIGLWLPCPPDPETQRRLWALARLVGNLPPDAIRMGRDRRAEPHIGGTSQVGDPLGTDWTWEGENPVVRQDGRTFTLDAAGRTVVTHEDGRREVWERGKMIAPAIPGP